MPHPEFDGAFYHATSKQKAAAILKEGLNPGSYLCIGDIADYYLETIEDDGDTPVLLKIDASDLSRFNLVPDMPGLEEPISTVVGLSEEKIWESWGETDQSWQACFALIGSVKSEDPIPARLITEDD
jgi:hypothetical protein